MSSLNQIYVRNPEGFKIFKEGLAEAFVCEEHSDCKLICGPHEFKLHKIVLMLQSGYFRNAFKKGTFKEGETGTIKLKAIQSSSEASEEADDSCDDPEIVKRMVEFFYHLDYFPNGECPLPEAEDDATATLSDSETEIQCFETGPTARRRVPKKRFRATRANSPVEESLTPIAPQAPTLETASASVASPLSVHIIEHAKVFAMAVKYQVDGLRDLATAKFEQSVKASWNHDDFAHAISIIYNSTADNVPQLRNIVVDVIHDHFDTLKHKAEFETVVTSIPALAYTLLKRVGTISGCTNGHKGQRATKFRMLCYTNFDICTGCKPWKFCPCCKGHFDGILGRS